MSPGKIAKKLLIGKTKVFKVLKKNRVPEFQEIKVSSKIKNINELISLRLLYFCDDLETLSKRLAIEILYQKPEKILIPHRIQDIIKKEKINNVISILNKINLTCDVEFAMN